MLIRRFRGVWWPCVFSRLWKKLSTLAHLLETSSFIASLGLRLFGRLPDLGYSGFHLLEFDDHGGERPFEGVVRRVLRGRCERKFRKVR